MTQSVHVNGVDLCVQTYGDPGMPAILLIAGAGSSMDGWSPSFCERLAAGPRFVVRYDHRDTGQSTTDPAGAPSYTSDDLLADVAGLLDAFAIRSAHLVGISMGGALAQLLALDRPGRVATLTLVSTSPGPGPDLPAMSAGLRDFFAETPAPDWSDRAAVIDYQVAVQRAYAGAPFDEPTVRATTAHTFDRTLDPAAGDNHLLLAGGDPWRSRLDQIGVPTLVLHGDADPLFGLPHGEALAAEIPGARLLVLPGVGHEPPPPSSWDIVVPAILALTSGGWQHQADRLASGSLAAGDPTGWFERLYAGAVAGETPMPWDSDARPELVDWVRTRRPDGAGRRAVVVGCGLGANAELVAGLGFDTVAFDIAATAVQQARQRNQPSTVDYRVADLLAPPADWIGAFDLVVEVYTVQALPDPPRAQAIANVSRLVAPGGTLVVVAAATSGAPAAVESGPPWPLIRAEIDAFAAGGLAEFRVEWLDGGGAPRWRAEFHRPA
jgi:pimeloyl-ACP methyl ester carboxylesterase/SAM-dependent methyltransferase